MGRTSDPCPRDVHCRRDLDRSSAGAGRTARAARGQQPAAQQPAPAPASPATAASKVTYSGCLKPGTAAGSWALENAEIPSMASAQAKPGDSPVGTSGAAMKAFNLSTKEDLKAHANHKIEVTGTVSQPSASASAPARRRRAHHGRRSTLIRSRWSLRPVRNAPRIVCEPGAARLRAHFSRPVRRYQILPQEAPSPSPKMSPRPWRSNVDS